LVSRRTDACTAHIGERRATFRRGALLGRSGFDRFPQLLGNGKDISQLAFANQSRQSRSLLFLCVLFTEKRSVSLHQ
jgi:hypothetical protein